MRRLFILFAVHAFLCTVCVCAQDSPSLGDVARQTRAQKQQKGAQTNSASSTNRDAQKADPGAKGNSSPTPSHVITNDEMPSHLGLRTVSTHDPHTADPSDSQSNSGNDAGDKQAQGEHWKSQIQAQKNNIADLQHQISELSSSIQYAGANCVSNCAQWNERQQQKQQEVDNMKAQLEEQQKQLDDMQESARKQGFGSSVYEP
jgi:hypothetical protein